GSNPETDMNREYLTASGVPETAISVLGAIASTRDEAVAVNEYVMHHPVRRITVVTTAFHTARTRWIFARVLHGPGVEIRTAASDSRDFSETDWYTSSRGRFIYSSELVRWLYYRLAY